MLWWDSKVMWEEKALEPWKCASQSQRNSQNSEKVVTFLPVSFPIFFLEIDLKIPHILMRSARWRTCIPNTCPQHSFCLDFSNLQVKSMWDSPDEQQHNSAPTTYEVLKFLLNIPGPADRNPLLPLFMCNFYKSKTKNLADKDNQTSASWWFWHSSSD